MASRPTDLNVPKQRISRALQMAMANSTPVDSPVQEIATGFELKTPSSVEVSPMSDREPAPLGTKSPSTETWRPARSRRTSGSSVTDSEGSSRKQSPSTEKAPSVVGLKSPSIETWKPLRSRHSSSSLTDPEGRNRIQSPSTPTVLGFKTPAVETWKMSSNRQSPAQPVADLEGSDNPTAENFAQQISQVESDMLTQSDKSPRPKSAGVTWNPTVVAREFEVEKGDEQAGQKGSKETAKIVMGPSVETRKRPDYLTFDEHEVASLKPPVNTGRFSSIYVPLRTTDKRSQRSK